MQHDLIYDYTHDNNNNNNSSGERRKIIQFYERWILTIQVVEATKEYVDVKKNSFKSF